MYSLFFLVCHLTLIFAEIQVPATVYGPPKYSSYAPLSAPLPQAPAPIQYPSAAPAPVQYPSAAPAPVQYPSAPVQYPSAAPAPLQYPSAAPAPVQYPSAAPAPVQYPSAAPAPVQYPSAVPAPPPPPPPSFFPSVPQSTYNAPAPITTGGELLSAPAPESPKDVPEEIILPQNTRLEIRDEHGQYTHGFSDDKGTKISEQGTLITTNGGWEYVIAKKGSFSYKSPEGKTVSVTYIADENGYRILEQKIE